MKPWIRRCLPPVLGALLGLAVTACDKGRTGAVKPATVSGPLTQRAYVWQREWSPRVSRAVIDHAGAFEELAVLAAQVEWDIPGSAPVIMQPVIDWAALKASGQPAGLVMRVHRTGKPAQVAETVAKILRTRLAEAAAAGVPVAEFQIDYDCPQKSLETYLHWLTAVRDSLHDTGIPLRITSLPSWLGEPAFAALADATDGYVLQVHSFDLTALGKAPTVCDPGEARDWVASAGRLGRPFYVALPTYRCLAGYAPDGHLLGMAADAGGPAWPQGTRILELSSDADAIAALVAGWLQERPAAMRGLYWYRLPVEGEARNWKWITLAKVMEGRTPATLWEVRASQGNPIDFTLWNAGEKDEPLPQSIHVGWSHAAKMEAADSLDGWTFTTESDSLDFIRSRDGLPRRLAPGSSTPLGWIRYHEATAQDPPFQFRIDR